MSLKLLQSTIERALYLLLLLVFIALAVVGYAVLNNNRRIVRQEKIFHQESVSNLQEIKQNQAIQEVALKEYIDCIIHINPQMNIQAQELSCFNGTPQVKQ